MNIKINNLKGKKVMYEVLNFYVLQICFGYFKASSKDKYVIKVI